MSKHDWRNPGKDRAEPYDGPLPVWIASVTTYLSRTGRTVAITLTGRMDEKSRMPGGVKRGYIPIDVWREKPIHALRSFLHSCRGVRERSRASELVWDARSLWTKEELKELAKSLPEGSPYVYRNREAREALERAVFKRSCEKRA
jgi:hypothetical protein